MRDGLNALVAQPVITVDALITLTSSLPVSELSSDTARLSFEGARILVALAGWSDVEVVQTGQLRPVVAALAEGISAGLPTTPSGVVLLPPRHMRTKVHYKAR